MALMAVAGLAAEARILHGRGIAAEASGADPARAAAIAERFLAAGADAILSFGIAGALAPGLAPGTILLPRRIVDRVWRNLCRRRSATRAHRAGSRRARAGARRARSPGARCDCGDGGRKIVALPPHRRCRRRSRKPRRRARRRARPCRLCGAARGGRSRGARSSARGARRARPRRQRRAPARAGRARARAGAAPGVDPPRSSYARGAQNPFAFGTGSPWIWVSQPDTSARLSNSPGTQLSSIWSISADSSNAPPIGVTKYQK